MKLKVACLLVLSALGVTFKYILKLHIFTAWSRTQEYNEPQLYSINPGLYSINPGLFSIKPDLYSIKPDLYSIKPDLLASSEPSWRTYRNTRILQPIIDGIRSGSDDSQTGGQSSNIEKVITNFTGDLSTDIALLKTKTKLVFNENLKPINLAKFLPKEGSIASISGFGKNDDDVGDPLVQMKQLVGIYNGYDGVGPFTFMAMAKYHDSIIQMIKKNSESDEADGIDDVDADFAARENDDEAEGNDEDDESVESDSHEDGGSDSGKNDGSDEIGSQEDDNRNSHEDVDSNEISSRENNGSDEGNRLENADTEESDGHDDDGSDEIDNEEDDYSDNQEDDYESNSHEEDNSDERNSHEIYDSD